MHQQTDVGSRNQTRHMHTKCMLNSSQHIKQKNHFLPRVITINVTENLCGLFKVHFISH